MVDHLSSDEERAPRLAIFGLNHRMVPIEEREQVAIDPEEAAAILDRIRGDADLPGGVLLSTCNRLEIYTSAPPSPALETTLRDFLGNCRPVVRELAAGGRTYFHRGVNAVRHLFEVAAGLDSAVLGESQILGQVRAAHRQAVEIGAAGPLLDRCFQSAVGAGKRVRRETELGSGAVSVSSAAVELASKIFADLGQRTALLLGAGSNGELTARILVDRGIGELWIGNRTPERARDLAEDLAARAVSFEDLDEVLDRADIVIASTGSERPILDRARMEGVMKRRGSRPIVLIDIAVPRDVDPAVGRLDHCFLTNIDDLTRIMDQNRANRERYVGHARRVVEEEVDRFARWFGALALGPVIRGLHDRFDRCLQRAIEQERGRFSAEEWPRVEEFTRSLLRKILHGPTTALRERGIDGLPDALRVEVVRQLFELETGEGDDALPEEAVPRMEPSIGDRGDESRIPDRDPK